MRIKELEKAAQRIPEMGGRRIGPFLRTLARETPNNTAIVELGCWLGAGTAQMALGLLDRNPGHGVTIDCFDNFHTSPSSAAKANRQGIALNEGDDTLPLVAGFLEPFGAAISLHKGMLNEETQWSGRPISLYVDDATKYKKTFFRCLGIFGPSFSAGTIMVFMDFFLFQRKPPDTDPKRIESMRAQFEFVNANEASFTKIDSLDDKSCAAFRYNGGIDFGRLA